MEDELSDLETVTFNSYSPTPGSFNYSAFSDTSTHALIKSGNYSVISEATVTGNTNYYILPQESNTAKGVSAGS